METEPADGVVDSLTLRFVGEEKDGTTLHELRAAHVAEVLQGLVGLSSDFTKAGVFDDGPAGSEVLVRPAQEGSFVIEVIRAMVADPSGTATAIAAGVGAVGVPSLSTNEYHRIFETEAQMSAIDFDNPTRWRVKTKDVTRGATVEDEAFLGRIAESLAIRKSDIFKLVVREDTVEKNGRARRTWTVLKVESHRRARDDDA